MYKEKIYIEQMTPHFRAVLLKDLEAKYLLQGEPNPSLKAQQKLADENKHPKNPRGWRRFRFFTLKGIDKARLKLGLPAIHFPRID